MADRSELPQGTPDDETESTRFLRLAQFSTDRAVDAVFWIDPTATILYVNDAACRALGYSREELVGRTVPEIDANVPADAWPARWAELKRRGSFAFESDHRTKDGRLLNTEVTVNYVVHEGLEYNCTIMRDITARKQTEARLNRHVQQVGALSRLAQRLNESPDIAEVFNATLDCFREVVGAERAAILVADRQGVNRFEAWRGLSKGYRQAVEGHTFGSADDPNLQPVTVADVDQDPAMAPFRSVVRGEGLRALAAVPLVVRRRTIGRCMLYFEQPYQLSNEDLELSQMIARTAAFAIERQRSHSETWASAGLLRAIVDSTTDAVFVKDLEGTYVLANPATGSFHGRHPSEIVGLTDADLLPAADATAIMERDQRIVTDRRTSSEEYTFTAADGLRRTFRSTKGPLFDESGAVYGVFGIAQDVTDRKASEERRRQSESRFRSLIQNSTDITTVLAADGTTLYESPAFYRLFGWTEAEIVGSNAFDLVHPDDRQRVFELFSEGLTAPDEIKTAQFRFRRSDGSYVMLEAIGQNRLNDPDVSGFVVNSRDVTERHRLWEQLRQAQKMEAIGRLAGGVAHDFNNLLTVINGYSELVLANRELPRTAKGPLEEIRKAGHRAAQLTNQLLAFGRQRVFKATAVDLNTTILELTAMLPRLIGEHIRLTTALQPNIGHVISDSGQLEQVVMNLAINARDAMPAGGTLTIETATRPDGFVSLTVRDTGRGMDADTLSHIFEPFFTTKEPGQGTGLGLATVYGIVTQSGGTIDVTSTPGEGTTFVVCLPRAEASPIAEGAMAEQASAGGSETVLLVEDELMVRTLARDVLTARGYRVLEAANGEEALQRYAGDPERIDLLLTDVVMPGICGRQLAERMIQSKPQVKVLFMSGYTEDRLLRGPMWQDVSLLQKPFTIEALERQVREALDQRPEYSS